MTDIASRHLLLALPPLLPDLTDVIEMPGGDFGLRFSDDMQMLVEGDAAQGRTVLSALVGEPPLSRLVDIQNAMLAYNGLWRSTGGGVLSRDGSEGPVMLSIDIGNVTDAHALAGLLTNLRAAVGAWRDFFLATPPEKAEAPAPEPELATMIRG